MGEILLHGAQTNGQRLFPDHAPTREIPSFLLMQSDDVARKIDQAVGAAVTARHIHAVHACDSTRHRDARSFTNNKAVVLKERIIVIAIGEITFATRIMIQSPEWGRVDRKIAGAIRQLAHALNAISIVDRELVGNALINYSHDGTSISFFMLFTRSMCTALFISETRRSNICSCCFALRW